MENNIETIYNTKIVISGNNLELYKLTGGIRTGYKREIKKSNIITPGNDRRVEKRRETLTNARNKIIRLIQSNPDLDLFITLTFKDEPTLKDSKKIIFNFFKRLKNRYTNLKYIWVYEHGKKKGRLHYHCLCNYPIDAKLVDNKYRKTSEHKQYERKIADIYKHGFVDCRSLIQENNTNIALYMAKYITKALEGQESYHSHIYGYSQNMNKPITVKCYDNQEIDKLLAQFVSNGYIIKYSNSYSMKYMDKNINSERGSTISYFDMKRKVDKYEN